ncbi:radical SAM protein [Terrisporobacter petrolearius]|uniref:radical SAM protein n=1 Tax=Terrisporobacter petrolearius TaxID=1460447 RepID=UPI001D161146|nr:radical SAM protein [Terrisporobacter petrolearius]MCC3862839.1 radical SAM protein [Terrisporobacter petrolearius]
MNLNELSMCRLNIQLTKKCNQRCKMCNSYNIKDEKELTTQEIFDIISNVCSERKICNIAFTGGEPTLRKDILEIVSFAKKHCENVSITTNGTFIKKEEDALKLIENGVNRFTISYHGIGNHSQFTGVKDSEKDIRRALSILSNISNYKDIYVKVGMLFTNETVNAIEDMIKYCEELKLKLYIELPDDSIPIFENTPKDEFAISNENIDEIVHNLNEWKLGNKPVLLTDNSIKYINKYLKKEPIIGECPLGYTDLYIGSNGNVYSGCWALEPIGNIRKDEIMNILNGEKYLENIDKMLRRLCPGCTCGYIFQSNFIK